MKIIATPQDAPQEEVVVEIVLSPQEERLLIVLAALIGGIDPARAVADTAKLVR